MSADRLTYCLERISSYRDFERLCTALLAGSDYPGIDPLGGTGDGGRDAIVRSDGNGQKIVFAYTVRGDWRVKLKHDCLRVRELKHNPDVFVFVCTEALNASEKDGAYRMVAQEFGWKLDLFDLERLRALLAGRKDTWSPSIQASLPHHSSHSPEVSRFQRAATRLLLTTSMLTTLWPLGFRGD
jgi:hypothetical protein